MVKLPNGIDSIFRYIEICSQRAEQLMQGARPRVESKHTKPTLIAIEEVNAGKVKWKELTKEELEAEQRELLEQYRQQVEEEAARAAQAAAAPEPEVSEEEELARLERLLNVAAPEPIEGDELVEEIALDEVESLEELGGLEDTEEE